jgi:starch-binding outer membrane protein, SusD/RagB family
MKKLLFLAITSLLVLTGCSDFLVADNKSNVTSDEYFNTKDGFETLVNFAYAQMKPLYADDPLLHSSGTDLYHRGRNAMPDVGLHTYIGLNAENGNVRTYYINCYKGIQAANNVLKYAETAAITPATDSIRSAEARFLRAFFYFELVQNFGGVALVKEYVNSILTSVPRNTTEQVYQFITDELEAVLVENKLPATALNGRITKQCVLHYLAKVYLTEAWDLDKPEAYTTAAAYALQAIVLGSGLNETFANLWLPANDNTHQEVIFAIQYDRASSVAAGIAETANGNNIQGAYCQYLGGSDQGYKNGSSGYVPSLRLMSLFQKGDARYEGTFMTSLYCKNKTTPKTSGDYYAPYNGTTAADFIGFYYPPQYACSAQDIIDWRASDSVRRTNTIVIPMTNTTIHPDLTSCDYWNAATTGDAVFGLPAVRKFDDPASSFLGNTCYRDIVLARLAETYLIAAEAYLMEGNNQELADFMLNVVRERAFRGSGETYIKSNITIDDILTERALEFVGERLRWKDLRRTKKLVEYNVLYNPEITSIDNFTGTDGKQKWYRPIPQSAIDLNNAEVEQNEGYVNPTTE